MPKKILVVGYEEGRIIDHLRSMNYEVLTYSDKLSIDYLQSNGVEFIVSFGYRHIIKKEVLDLLPEKVINLHISYLPWNKGADPNLWSFIEETPKGVTIHQVDEGLDTGKILLQKEVSFSAEDDLKTSYSKLVVNIEDLFIQHAEDLVECRVEAKDQMGEGSAHHSSNKAGFVEFLGENWLNIKVNTLSKLYQDYLKESTK